VASGAGALPYRDFITVGLLVKKMALRSAERIVPDCWIYVQDRGVKLGRVQIFNNWSPYMVADAGNTVWLGLEYFCNEGDALWEMGDEAFIRFAVEECCRIGFVTRDDVIDATRMKMKKAYPAYFGAYEEMPRIRAYLDGMPNLYCIGRNGQHRYNNMDHSMLTAWEAVRALKVGGGDKTRIWDVNTERAYHEEKGN
jgi:protoporphyrinogen oxidase